MRDSGVIPCDQPQRTWAGNGQGHECAACAKPILKTEVEYEVDVRSGVTIRLHRSCHGVWLEECAEAKAGPGEVSPAP